MKIWQEAEPNSDSIEIKGLNNWGWIWYEGYHAHCWATHIKKDKKTRTTSLCKNIHTQREKHLACPDTTRLKDITCILSSYFLKPFYLLVIYLGTEIHTKTILFQKTAMFKMLLLSSAEWIPDRTRLKYIHV